MLLTQKAATGCFRVTCIQPLTLTPLVLLSVFRREISLWIFCVDIWKVSITTGVYEPEEGTDELGNDYEELNTNNNANGHEEDKSGSNFVSQKKRSTKYQVAPWAPVNDLFIVIYGDRGKTGLLPLMSDQPSDRKKFLPGSVDNFKVKYWMIFLC